MDIEQFKKAFAENTKKWRAQEERERIRDAQPYVPTDCKKDGHAWNVYERVGHMETLECAVCRELKQVYVD